MRTDRVVARAVERVADRLGAAIATCCVCCLLGGAAPALAAHNAAPNPKGKQLYLDGKKAYDDGKYDEALTDFQKAFALDARPAFWFNIGECQRQLGKTTDAVKSYQKYLQGVPRAKNRDEVKRIIADLKAKPPGAKGASSAAVSSGGEPGAATTTTSPTTGEGAATPGASTPGSSDSTQAPDAATTTSTDPNAPAATAPSTSGDAGAPGEGVPTWAYVAGGTAAAVAVAAVVGVVTVQALTAPSLGRLDLTSRQGAVP